MKHEKPIIKCSCGRDLPMHWYEEGLAINKPKHGAAYCILNSAHKIWKYAFANQ